MGTTNDSGIPVPDDAPTEVDYTAANLAALNELIVSGEKKVRLNNREVEFHSITQMMKLRDAMRAELAANDVSVVRRKPRVHRSRLGKGL